MAVLATGDEAIRRAEKVIHMTPDGDSPPFQYQGVGYPMVPGTIHPPNMMIVARTNIFVDFLYFQQNRWELLELSAPQFAQRAHELGAAARGGAKAAWLIPIARMETAFLIGVLTGPAEIIAANLVEIAMWMENHRTEVKEACTLLEKILPGLFDLRVNCPALWREALHATDRALIQAFVTQFTQNFKSGTNIAMFLGRLLATVVSSYHQSQDAAASSTGAVASAGFHSFIKLLTLILEKTAKKTYITARINVVEMGVGSSLVAAGVSNTIRKELSNYPGKEQGLHALCTRLARLDAILEQMNNEVSAAKGGGAISFKPLRDSAASNSALSRLHRALFGN